MSEKQENPELFIVALRGATLAGEAIAQWERIHPGVIDYRVEEAKRGLRETARALSHLATGKHYPGHAAALQRLREHLAG